MHDLVKTLRRIQDLAGKDAGNSLLRKIFDEVHYALNSIQPQSGAQISGVGTSVGTVAQFLADFIAWCDHRQVQQGSDLHSLRCRAMEHLAAASRTKLPHHLGEPWPAPPADGFPGSLNQFRNTLDLVQSTASRLEQLHESSESVNRPD